MALNTIEYAQVFQTQLDQAAVRDSVTGWMDANAGQVIYNGGNTVKIPKITVEGMANYDRSKGYTDGAVTLAYETRTLTQDRGRRFMLDAMDVDETNFVATAGAVMGEFQRTQVVPEIDAYRISKIASTAISGSAADTMVKYGYVPKADPTSFSVLREVKTGIAKIRSNGYNGALVCHIEDIALSELEIEMAGRIQAMNWTQGGVITTVPAVDGVAMIATPSNRMVTAITVYDGKSSGQEKGGFVAASDAKNINFVIIPVETPIAVSKQDVMRIFDPVTNQAANAWAMDYRRYHDLWIKDNATNSIYVNVKEAKA